MTIFFTAGNTAVSFLAIVLAILVAQSRVEAGVHSLREVVLGAVLAILLTAMVYRVMPMVRAMVAQHLHTPTTQSAPGNNALLHAQQTPGSDTHRQQPDARRGSGFSWNLTVKIKNTSVTPQSANPRVWVCALTLAPAASGGRAADGAGQRRARQDRSCHASRAVCSAPYSAEPAGTLNRSKYSIRPNCCLLSC